MSKVLVVTGTGGSFDTVDLPPALVACGIECNESPWNEITDPPGHYDLAVLLGLTSDRTTAHRYASTVRAAIGPNPKLLIVSGWDRSVMAASVKEKYDAEYEVRDGPILNLVAKVLSMLKESKTAP